MKIKVNGQEAPKNNYWYEKAYMDGEEKTIGMVHFFENYFKKSYFEKNFFENLPNFLHLDSVPFVFSKYFPEDKKDHKLHILF